MEQTSGETNKLTNAIETDGRDFSLNAEREHGNHVKHFLKIAATDIRSIKRAEVRNAMAATTESMPSSKKKNKLPSEAIRDGAGRLERDSDKGPHLAKARKPKAAKKKVAGRMPARSEAVSGNDADGLTPVSGATPTSVASATPEGESMKPVQPVRKSGAR